MEVLEGYPESEDGYEWLDSLGVGSISTVTKVKVKYGKFKGNYQAIKKVDFDKVSDFKLESIMKNIVNIHHLNHPNIVSYPFSFFDDKCLYLGMEYLQGGSLFQIIQDKFPEGIKDETLLISIIKPLLLAIDYLHDNKHIHRDIKASNILISEDGEIKLADHGLSAKLKKGKKHESLVGSPCWLAPEIIDGNTEGYGLSIDIWALGITCLEMIYGKPPYYDETGMTAILKIIRNDPPQLESTLFSTNLRNFVNSCLVKDPKYRPTTKQLITTFKSMLKYAKTGNYIKNKLGPFYIIHTEKNIDDDNHPIKKKKSNIKWDFDLGEDEDDDTLSKDGFSYQSSDLGSTNNVIDI